MTGTKFNNTVSHDVCMSIWCKRYHSMPAISYCLLSIATNDIHCVSTQHYLKVFVRLTLLNSNCQLSNQLTLLCIKAKEIHFHTVFRFRLQEWFRNAQAPVQFQIPNIFSQCYLVNALMQYLFAVLRQTHSLIVYLGLGAGLNLTLLKLQTLINLYLHFLPYVSV